MNNRTFKKDPYDRGQNEQNALLLALIPLWQGCAESNRNPRFWRPIY